MPKKGCSTKVKQQSKPSPLSSKSFHLLEALEPKLPKLLDDSSSAAASELDSISNNGSCSGESEDQLAPPSKEKAFIPGLEASPDKQEKIRLKNERKHQRHKERKTKELKDRCAGYLMSRKLDGLAQQLVSMGFPSERATMALILNEGDMEKSITFLLEGGEIPKTLPKSANLKLDISDQLARLEDMEARYGYSMADIERAVVACEGDVDATRVWLRDHYTQTGQTVAAGAVAATGPPQRQDQQLKSSKLLEAKLLNEARLRQQVLSSPASAGPAPVSGFKTVPLPPASVWQRAPVGNNFPSLSGVAAAAAAAAAASAARLDQVSLKYFDQNRERDVITDWRNSHQKAIQLQQQQQRYQRLEEAPYLLKPQLQQQLQQQQQQQQFHQPQMVHPANLYHPHPLQQLASPSSPQPPSLHPPPWNPSNPSDSWDIPVARSVDYHAIDWSTGIPPSPFAKPGPSFGASSTVPRSMVRSDGWSRAEAMQSGYRSLPEVSDLVSQEWTTPFAGKDLVHHQAVRSL